MRFAGEMAALGTAVCWATGSTLFASAGQRIGSLVLNRLRLTAAAVLLAAALLFTRGAPWPTWASPEQIALLALSGLIGFVLGDNYYFRSLVILGPGRATLIASLAPLFTAVLAWPLLGEIPGPLAALGMALTLGGILFVLWQRGHRQAAHVEGSVAMGVIAGVLGAIGQAVGYVISKQALRSGDLDPLSATVIRVISALLGVWMLALLQGAAVRSLAALRDRRATLFMIGGAVAGPFLGVTLSLAALKYIEAGVAASITSIFPVLALLLSAYFYGERMSWRIVGGTLVAVMGVVVLFLR